jgi:hypothetical protein
MGGTAANPSTPGSVGNPGTDADVGGASSPFGGTGPFGAVGNNQTTAQMGAADEHGVVASDVPALGTVSTTDMIDMAIGAVPGMPNPAAMRSAAETVGNAVTSAVTSATGAEAAAPEGHVGSADPSATPGGSPSPGGTDADGGNRYIDGARSEGDRPHKPDMPSDVDSDDDLFEMNFEAPSIDSDLEVPSLPVPGAGRSSVNPATGAQEFYDVGAVPQFQGAGLNFVERNPMARGFHQQQKRNRLEDKRERQEERRERRQEADQAMRAAVQSEYAPAGSASPDPMSRMGGGSDAQASPGKKPQTLTGKLARVTSTVPGQGKTAVELAQQAERAERERWERETEQEMAVLETAASGQTELAKQMASRYGVRIPKPILEDGNRAQALKTGSEIYGQDGAKLAKFLDAAEKSNWDLNLAMEIAGPPRRGGQGGNDYDTLDERRVREMSRKEALRRTEGAMLSWDGNTVVFDQKVNPNAKQQYYQHYNTAYQRMARRFGGGGQSPYAGKGKPAQPTRSQQTQQKPENRESGPAWYEFWTWGGGSQSDSSETPPKPQAGARADQRAQSNSGRSDRQKVPDVVRNPGKIQDKLDSPLPAPASRKDLKQGEVYAHPKHGPVYYDGKQFWPVGQAQQSGGAR